MRRPLAVFLLTVTTLVAVTRDARADELKNQLTADQLRLVETGRDVVLTDPVDGNPWPRARIYRIVRASPEEVTAVFFDYDGATSFVPSLLQSNITHRIDAKTMDVDYKVDVPILPDESYTCRNSLRPIDEGAYRIDWKLLKATTTRASVGCLRVEPYKDRAILCYENFVTPGSKMAGLLVNQAIDQMRETVRALALQVEKSSTKRTVELTRQVDQLRSALQEQSP